MYSQIMFGKLMRLWQNKLVNVRHYDKPRITQHICTISVRDYIILTPDSL